MEETLETTNFKSKFQKIKRKFFELYYGNPAKTVKIIVVTGSTGKDIVANYLQNILTTGGQKSTLILNDTKKPQSFAKIQKTLSRALQSGSDYVIFEAPAASLTAFSNLPIYMGILTDIVPSQPGYATTEAYLSAKASIFRQNPIFSILNRDDNHYDYFAKSSDETAIISFGRNRDASVRINRSKLYKKGAEANLSTSSKAFDVATFVTSEESVYYMAAATAAATAIDLDTDAIVNGIADYEP